MPWLRSLVQIIPLAGGSVDTLIAWRGTVLAQRRFEEFVTDVSRRLQSLEASEASQQLLESEEFVEVLRSSIEAATRTASAEKRQNVAAFLAGTIRGGHLDDVSQQIADDLIVLRELHLRVLSALPDHPRIQLPDRVALAERTGLSLAACDKALSDLQRLGFVRLNTDSVGAYGGGAPHLETTEYMSLFMTAIREGSTE
jgi:hypothetical protein